MRRYPRLLAELRLANPAGTQEYFLYRPLTGEQYEINEVAYQMIGQMTGENDIEAIRQTIESQFRAVESVTEDLERLLSGMVAEKCVVIDER
jgi:hypothetical protein